MTSLAEINSGREAEIRERVHVREKVGATERDVYVADVRFVLAELDVERSRREMLEQTLEKYAHCRHGQVFCFCVAEAHAALARLEGEEPEAKARALHRLTTDDSKNEPPDFTVDDGMDV